MSTSVGGFKWQLAATLYSACKHNPLQAQSVAFLTNRSSSHKQYSQERPPTHKTSDRRTHTAMGSSTFKLTVMMVAGPLRPSDMSGARKTRRSEAQILFGTFGSRTAELKILDTTSSTCPHGLRTLQRSTSDLRAMPHWIKHTTNVATLLLLLLLLVSLLLLLSLWGTRCGSWLSQYDIGRKVAVSILDQVTGFFKRVPVIFLGGKSRQARKAVNLTATCEQIFQKSWELRRFTNLWPSTAC
jgi:hypothetical protein